MKRNIAPPMEFWSVLLWRDWIYWNFYNHQVNIPAGRNSEMSTGNLLNIFAKIRWYKSICINLPGVRKLCRVSNGKKIYAIDRRNLYAKNKQLISRNLFGKYLLSGKNMHHIKIYVSCTYKCLYTCHTWF